MAENELTPEQQEKLEDILNNRKNIPYQEYRRTLLDIIRDIKFNRKNIDKGKLLQFWEIFGWVPQTAWDVVVQNQLDFLSTFGNQYEEDELPPREDNPGMSYQQYINMISYSLGRNWNNLEPEIQEGFNYLYEITPSSDLRAIANAAADHHDLMINAVLEGKDPTNITITVDDANI